MLTRDEILNIDAHCRENGVSRSAYLRELGRSSNEYYNSRRRLFGGDKSKTPTDALATQEQTLVEDYTGNSGGFLPIQFSHANQSTTAPKKRTRSQRKQEQELANGNTLLIEMRTPSGTELRIQGQINIKMLKEIIHASGGGLQDV